MHIDFLPTDLEDLRPTLVEYNRHLAPICSFLEDHIRDAMHYRITIDSAVAGFVSVHGGATIVQFGLGPEFRGYGQDVFREARRLESVHGALVASSDQFFLVHSIDDYSRLSKQACMFESVDESGSPDRSDDACTFRVAEPTDVALVEELSGDFFEQSEKLIETGLMYVVDRSGSTVGFGLIERNEFALGSASIGIFTVESARRTGVGTEVVRFLAAECRRLDLRAHAGCWYYNHASKRTLERGGMAATGRIFRVVY